MSKSRALLLDRDGVINTDHGYVGTLARFTFLPGLFAFLRTTRERGYRLAILTNQAGVARGLYTETDHEHVTAHMLAGLRQEGVEIDLVLSCFEHPDGTVAHYKRESFWRKPNPGMVLEAVRRLDINPTASAFLGDNIRDMQAAQSGGIGHCLWLTAQNPTSPEGVQIVSSFNDVLTILPA